MAEGRKGAIKDFLRILWGMVRRPAATLARLNEDGGRAWLWMAALVLLLSMTPVWAGRSAAEGQPLSEPAAETPDVRVSAVASGQKGEPQVEYGDEPVEGGDVGAGATSVGALSTVLGMLGQAAGVIVRWLLWAVALYIVATVSGGRSSFGQTLHMVAWTWLPYAVRGLVQTVYLLFGGAAITFAGLSGFAPGAREAAAGTGTLSAGQAVVQHLLAQVDVYWVWNLVLLVLGVMTVAHLARRKSILVTAGVWLLITALGLVPVLISSSLANVSGM